jgi:hypothetical protein
LWLRHFLASIEEAGRITFSLSREKESTVKKIVLDAALRTKPRNLTEPLELRDESGHVLAHITPARDLSEYAPLERQVSDEELRRRSQSNEKTYTTAEVLAYIGMQ